MNRIKNREIVSVSTDIIRSTQYDMYTMVEDLGSSAKRLCTTWLREEAETTVRHLKLAATARNATGGIPSSIVVVASWTVLQFVPDLIYYSVGEDLPIGLFDVGYVQK
jgi:hypothetical protein